MKSKILLLLVIFAECSVCFSADDGLMTAVRLLAQGRDEGCGLCADDLVKKAVKILDRDFFPGRNISADAFSCFMITKDCDKNEFVLSTYPGRGMLSPSDSVNRSFPLVTYRIHSDSSSLPGINSKDFTSESALKSFSAGFLKQGKMGVGHFELIPYKYGDGKCFVFLPKANKIQFQCRIISVKELLK